MRRTLSGAGAAATALAATISLAAPISLVSSPASATQVTFCNTLRREHPVRPPGELYATWHPYVTRHLAFFQRLDSEATPLMGPHALNGLVSILENFTTAANDVQIKADIAAHPRWWTLGWGRYYSDIRYCLTHPGA